MWVYFDTTTTITSNAEINPHIGFGIINPHIDFGIINPTGIKVYMNTFRLFKKVKVTIRKFLTRSSHFVLCDELTKRLKCHFLICVIRHLSELFKYD